MILVVGGMASGKKEYVTGQLGYQPHQLADGVLDACPVVYNLQNLVKINPQNSLDLLPILLQKEVVVCNEVGSGVIPLATQDVLWREATGRLCNALAENAEKVVRLVSGIPVVLKGD